MTHKTFLLAGSALALAAFTVAGASFAAAPTTKGGGGGGGNSTAQSVMVNVNLHGNLTIVDTQVYAFDDNAAAGYFSNALNGTAPTVSCTGPGCGTAPTAPGAPAPNALKVNDPVGQMGAVQLQRCTFFTGGDLVPSTYTQTASISSGSGKTGANYTYTYTYNITPTGSPAPLTAWNLVTETNPDGTVPVTVTGQVAGESVLVKSGAAKYSFSILTASGDQTSTRVSGLAWTVDGAVAANPGSFTNSGVDFTYTGNAGVNGTATSYLRNGDDLAILATNAWGSTSDVNAEQLADVDTLHTNLGLGSHSIQLSGSVKGNSIDTTSTGSAISFAVSKNVNIIGQSCGGL